MMWTNYRDGYDIGRSGRNVGTYMGSGSLSPAFNVALQDCECVNSDLNVIDGLVMRATRDIVPGEELLLTTDMTQVWVPMR
jgi:hypothetical protein